jgi:hypothetical protein
MHGLANRALQRFIEETAEPGVWARAARRASPGAPGFEALLSYDDEITEALIRALAEALGRPEAALLDDVGTWLVAHKSNEGLRRLLRFGGESFADFLHSLEELRDRARLAVPDLILPALDIREHAPGRFTLAGSGGPRGFAMVLAGLLRAMADEYGALAVVDIVGEGRGGFRLAVTVAEAEYAESRRFILAERRATA